MRFWKHALPRTATRKVKRAEVREELIRLLAMSKSSRREGAAVPTGRRTSLALWCHRWTHRFGSGRYHPGDSPDSELGLSSLQLVELRLLIEERGRLEVDADALAACETVNDLVALVDGREVEARDKTEPSPAVDERQMPEFVSDMGRRVIGGAQRALYDKAFNVRVRGREHIPRNEQVLVISNHTSHLDMGLVKYALGDYAPNLAALAATDYFFDTQYKRDFFEPFTTLLPVDRSGSLETSLRHAEKAIHQGRIVLVFPEGTRSVDGNLKPFKQGVGYLQNKSQLSVLPIYLRGTYRAMPKGADPDQT